MPRILIFAVYFSIAMVSPTLATEFLADENDSTLLFPRDVDIDADEAYAALATDNNSEEVWVVDLSTFTQEQAIDATGNENGIT